MIRRTVEKRRSTIVLMVRFPSPATNMTIAPRVRQLLTPVGALRGATKDEQLEKSLPWSVTWASSVSDFEEAIRLRSTAYGRRFGGARSFQANTDEHDFALNAFVLLARRKESGELLGTMRVAFGVDSQIEMLGFHPRPQLMAGIRLGEARRLSLKPWRMATLVKLSLWKAFYYSAVARDVEKMLIAARPPMNDDYRLLTFEEAMPGGAWFEPGSLPEPHELMLLNLEGLEDRLKAKSAELHRFMYVLRHPDIQVIDARAINPLSNWSVQSMLEALESDPEFGLAAR